MQKTKKLIDALAFVPLYNTDENENFRGFIDCLQNVHKIPLRCHHTQGGLE